MIKEIEYYLIVLENLHLQDNVEFLTTQITICKNGVTVVIRTPCLFHKNH